MVSVANQEVKAWGARGLKGIVDDPGAGSWINNRQDSGKQGKRIPSSRQSTDRLEHSAMRTPSPMVVAIPVMYLQGAVDADGDPDIELDEDIDDLIGQEHAVCLNVEPARCRKRRPKLTAQAAQTMGAKDQGFATMQHNTQRLPLTRVEVGQLPDGSQLNGHRHALRLSTPMVISHMIDVAVAAIQIASTRDLEKDRVDHGRSL